MADDTPARRKRPSGPQSDAETTDPPVDETTPAEPPGPPTATPTAAESPTAGPTATAPPAGTPVQDPLPGTAPWGDPVAPPPTDTGEPWHGAAGQLSHNLSRAMHLLRAAEHDVVNIQIASGNTQLAGVRASLSRAMEYIENEGQPAAGGGDA